MRKERSVTIEFMLVSVRNLTESASLLKLDGGCFVRSSGKIKVDSSSVNDTSLRRMLLLMGSGSRFAEVGWSCAKRCDRQVRRNFRNLKKFSASDVPCACVVWMDINGNIDDGDDG